MDNWERVACFSPLIKFLILHLPRLYYRNITYYIEKTATWPIHPLPLHYCITLGSWGGATNILRQRLRFRNLAPISTFGFADWPAFRLATA